MPSIRAGLAAAIIAWAGIAAAQVLHVQTRRRKVRPQGAAGGCQRLGGEQSPVSALTRRAVVHAGEDVCRIVARHIE
jgi:hypothetical protein